MGKLTVEERKKVRKPLLWIGMASIVMSFAGLTSGYVVSRSALLAENAWMQFALPSWFLWATIVIVLSSISMIWAKRSVRHNNIRNLQIALLCSLGLGLLFVVLQVLGWQELIAQGYYFTGVDSHTASSWVYIITFLHWLHLLSGIIVLAVTSIRARKGAYHAAEHYGLDMSAIYWHFLGLLWIYLFLFLSFIR